MSKDDDVALKAGTLAEIPAPDLAYRPEAPARPKTRMGLIGCGGISSYHLTAAKELGVTYTVLSDLDLDKAKARRDEFFPEAEVTDDPDSLLDRGDVDALDLAVHPEVRVGLIEKGLEADKHILSQKPYVLDLEVGARLAALAKAKGRVLAVNQNGRWAPYVGWSILAAKQGLLGEIQSLDWSMQWDHTWTKGTPFEQIHHLVLYDFAIHWIDITTQIFSGRPVNDVFARVVEANNQEIVPPALANVSIGFEGGLGTLAFSAHAKQGPEERFAIVGSEGTIVGSGELCRINQIQYFNAKGRATIDLEGSWFPGGFVGTLGEFLLAIEDQREPCHSAENNLRSLEICFAAIGSADSGVPVKPGEVTKISK